jgi:hypothetical protein
MDALQQLQQWYLGQCDGDWEHSYGVTVATLDNPGWHLQVELSGTPLENRPFAPVHYGMFDDAESSGHDWIHCKVDGGKFVGAGGPLKLGELITVFLRWAAA